MKRNYYMLYFTSFTTIAVVGCQATDVEVLPYSNTVPTDAQPLEKFVIEKFITSTGLIRTDIKERKENYLSETIGLWLSYLYERGDAKRFAEQVAVLRHYFLLDGVISWEINSDTASTVNALIDDLRISRVLILASQRFEEPSYQLLAQKIGEALQHKQVDSDLFTDFVDVKNGVHSKTLTISYIDSRALQQLNEIGVVTTEMLTQHRKILQQAKEGATYAKAYDIEAASYIFEDELHLVDQLYIALNSERWAIDTTDFAQWLQQHWQRDAKLFGRYNVSSNQPAVSYESPAVYALALLYYLEREDVAMAQTFVDKLESMQVGSGYINLQTNDTHAFDNILPLLAMEVYNNAR